MNLTQLIERVRDIVAEKGTDQFAVKQWENAEIVRHLNSAVDSLWNRTVMADEDWGLDFMLFSDFTATLKTDQGGWQTYYIKEPLPVIRHMDYQFDAYSPGKEIPNVGFERRVDRPWGDASSTEWGYKLGANEHILHITKGVSSLDTTKLRLWFLRPAPHLAQFGVSSYPNTSTLRIATTTDPTLGPPWLTEKNAYRYMTVYCKTVAAGATPQGDEFVVDTWVDAGHPNWDMLLMDAHGLAAGATTWETVPLWPRTHHDLLAWVAAERCMVKGGDRPGRAAVQEEAAKQFDDFIQRVQLRQIQTPRAVHRTGWI